MYSKISNHKLTALTPASRTRHGVYCILSVKSESRKVEVIGSLSLAAIRALKALQYYDNLDGQQDGYQACKISAKMSSSE